jgi:hypothetical protein
MKNINIFLSVPDDHPYSKILKQNCMEAIKVYYFEWRSPITMKKLIWDNLKLIYLWFMIPVIFLIFWGLIKLDYNNILWLIGLVIFIIPTLCEFYWFYTYFPFKYYPLTKFKYIDISKTWKNP